MIPFRTQVSAYHESGRGPIPGLVRENARAAPELAELIDDLSVIEKHRVGMYMHLHHPLAVGLAVDASLAQWQPARIAVGESGQTRRATGAPNCRVPHVIDAERFLALFFDRLCPASSEE